MEDTLPFYQQILANGIHRGLSPEDIFDECVDLLCNLAELRGLSKERFNEALNRIKKIYDPVNLSEEVIETFNNKFPL